MPIPGRLGKLGDKYRPNGTLKGPGFLGTLRRPDGKISTELSIGVNIDGKETLIPTLVPTLNDNEIEYLLGGGQMTPEIVNKAVEYYRMRMNKGEKPFME